ncbi:MAG: polysaccharide deacetylase family protein [Hyphomicrobiaceae bacterium]|nr:polysaccharide deacetylase family protein [Hyphomicrobiaceae bacterium]
MMLSAIRPMFGQRVMASFQVIAVAACAALTIPLPATAAGLPKCASDGSSLGVARIVEIDTSTGALFGGISTQAREPRFLGPKEVVLTFDDGPMPAVTRPILDTLDQFCTRATFYSVGRMAIAYPAMTREIMARGHTLGTHTWSHPLNLKRVPIERSREEIEKGHAAVTMAAGRPIAPFFRFPGLSDSGPMLKHLQTRGIASFTVDAVSNDSYISDPERLLARTLREVENQNGGIVLFHDIKAVTARILPRFLAELKARGFKVVHVVPKGTVAPVKDYDGVLTAMLAKNDRDTKVQPLVPFYGRVKPGETGTDGPSPRVPLATIAPVARDREPGPALATARRVASRKPGTAVRGWEGRSPGPATSGPPTASAPSGLSVWAPVVISPR